MDDPDYKSIKTLYHKAFKHWFYTELCHGHGIIKIMQQVKRTRLTEETAVTESNINISGKFCYAKKLKYNCVKLGTIVFCS